MLFRSYIRKWVPELANVSNASLIDPPAGGRPIASGYPLPILDHSVERDRTLDLFARHKATLGGAPSPSGEPS